MRKYSTKKVVILGLMLFFVALLPAAFMDSFRCWLNGCLSPLWRGADALFGLKKNEYLERVHKLEIENHLLRCEIGQLHAEREKRYADEALEKESRMEKKEAKEKHNLLAQEIIAVPARVIYRDPSGWGSSLWINVGEETNKQLGRTLIQKNSPVVYGRGVVGAIDYVGQRQSKVKLITDSTIKPSVRAARGNPQNFFLKENIDNLLRHLKARSDLSNRSESVIKHLVSLRESFSCEEERWFLAKGIIQGSKAPLSRSSNVLFGSGFNYDFDDEKGCARDLKSGKPVSGVGEAIPILKEGDLLVTTGFDGIFPPGLRVGVVSKVYPLKEGSYTYEIEAIPSAYNLNELTSLFVIPPLGFNADDIHPVK